MLKLAGQGRVYDANILYGQNNFLRVFKYKILQKIVSKLNTSYFLEIGIQIQNTFIGNKFSYTKLLKNFFFFNLFSRAYS